MFIRPILFLGFLPALVLAWESPLPFSNKSIASAGPGIFANPANSALSEVTEMGFGWAEISTPASARTQQWWTAQVEGPGHAEGLRLVTGDGPYQARFDLALATEWLGMVSPGIRLGYISSEVEADHGLMDLGLDFHPWSTVRLGYWMQNMASGGREERIHHSTLELRPFAPWKGWAADFQFGIGSSYQNRDLVQRIVYAQIPLLQGLRIQTQWDADSKEGAVGIIFQATGQVAGGLGWSKVKNQGDIRREVGVIYRPDQRTPFLVGAGTVVDLDLNTTITEGSPSNGWFASKGEIGFRDLLDRFDVLEANPHINTVILRLGKAHCGWAMAEEIRDRITGLRAHGKHVVAYLEQVSPLNYFLASAADKVALQPQGYFAVTGLSAEVMFYRGFFDKLGVEPQFLRHGKFKSFEEPYMRTGFSDPAREDLSEYLASLWNHYLETIAKARTLPVDSLRAILESGEISLAHALKCGLIDTLIQPDQILEFAGGKHAVIDKTPAEKVFHQDWNIPPKIALVVVTGEMVLGNSGKGWLAGPDLAGAHTVAAQLRQARLTPGVRAVVLRVDSPGGSAQAADIMAREVDLLRQAHIPVVASVGHDAASGGYYLICGTDLILAEPNSTVGSIGVLWGKFILNGLYDKLGLKVETVKTSPHADANTMTRAWDSTEVDILQRHMDDFYRDFVAKVAAGRHLSKAKVDSLGQGRIFTGTQALANGLIDRLGGLADAVTTAAGLAGLKGKDRYVVEAMEPNQGGSSLSTFSREWSRAPTGLAILSGEMERLQALSQPGLWAISPELAGWLGQGGTVRE